jgi:hypothetical protein
MKLILICCLIFLNLFISCKKTEIYSDNFRLESKNVVYGTISFESNGKTFSKKILDKDSIKQFVEDLNDSEYIEICKKVNSQGVIGLVVKDTGLIRLEIIDNKIRVPTHNKCYRLNKKYLNTIR